MEDGPADSSCWAVVFLNFSQSSCWQVSSSVSSIHLPETESPEAPRGCDVSPLRVCCLGLTVELSSVLWSPLLVLCTGVADCTGLT